MPHALGSKVITMDRTSGPVMISADLHGHWDDFARLRDVFLSSAARGEDPIWIGIGDWVHGPPEPQPRPVDANGVPLYAYVDASPRIIRELFALMDAHPGKVVTLLGNHEHGHIWCDERRFRGG